MVWKQTWLFFTFARNGAKDPNSDLIQLENGKVGFKNTERDVIQLRPFKSSLLNMNLQANEVRCKFLFPHLMAAEV